MNEMRRNAAKAKAVVEDLDIKAKSSFQLTGHAMVKKPNVAENATKAVENAIINA